MPRHVQASTIIDVLYDKKNLVLCLLMVGVCIFDYLCPSPFAKSWTLVKDLHVNQHLLDKAVGSFVCRTSKALALNKFAENAITTRHDSLDRCLGGVFGMLGGGGVT